MIRRPPRSTLSSSSAASDVYKRQDLPSSTSISYERVRFLQYAGSPIGCAKCIHGKNVLLILLNDSNHILTIDCGDDTYRGSLIVNRYHSFSCPPRLWILSIGLGFSSCNPQRNYSLCSFGREYSTQLE